MIDGIVNVYKEKGFTSHDVVAKMRGILKQKKIGHTGTLDPDAVGVLPVCLGKGTKLCDMITDKSKKYEAVMLLGCITDTQDTSGTILEEHPVQVTKEQIQEVIAGFEGAQKQIPPMYSALKVNGKRLYELAREGREVERKARNVIFYSINVLEIALPYVKMEVHCSKGTYIRTLCHDIGEKLGCGACMSHLTRTQAGSFSIEDALKLDEIQRLWEDGQLGRYITPVDEMFLDYQEVTVKKEMNKLIYNGNRFLEEHIENQDLTFVNEELVRVYDQDRLFIGIYKYKNTGKQFYPEKIFMSDAAER